MKNILNANIKTWHVLVLIAVLVLTNSAPVYAAPPFAVGDILIATDSSNTEIQLEGAAAITDLSATFTVPSGKTAKVVAFYSIFAVASYGGCGAEFRLDSPTGPILSPGEMKIDTNMGATDMNGFISDIGPGTHTVYVNMRSLAGEPDPVIDCYLHNRSLILIVRIN